MPIDIANTTRSGLRPAISSRALRERALARGAHPKGAGIYALHGKRALDITGALVLLLVFSPLMLMIAAMMLTQRGPLMFGHRRVGRDGADFHCMKFRTMVVDAEERLQALLASDPEAREEWQRDRKLANDPRITPAGNLLRRTSLDELPQLFNVLRGEMSLVGPRPVTRAELQRYGDRSDCYLALRPGLTGKWQVSGRNDVSYDSRVALDDAYSREYSLRGDLGLIFQTAGVVLRATGK